VTVLQPPAVPVFIADPTADAVAVMNSSVRDPLTFLIDPPTARLTRANALNLTENVHQYVPWDTAVEDSASGWTSPSVVGGGGSTTLNGATTVGATSATLTSATGFAIGDVARFETSGANVEYRVLTGVAGNVISWSSSAALALAHANGSTVTEVTSDPSRYVCQAPGWYDFDFRVSLSGTGAANMAFAGSIAVNFGSHTGISGGAGWEGTYHGPPTGASTQFKTGIGANEVYLNAGDFVQVDLFYTTESAMTAVDTTAGWVCALDLIWNGV